MLVRLDSAADQPILTALRTGDHRRAAQLMVGSYAPAVLRLCKLIDEPEAAEDLAHDCLARAFRAFGSFQASASPRAWLLALCASRCLERVDERLAEHRPSASPNVAAFAGDLSIDGETARAAFERLDPAPRMVLGAHVGELFASSAEAAARFGLDIGELQRLWLTALAVIAADLGAEPAEGASPSGTAGERYPQLLAGLQVMRWRPSPSLARRLEMLAAAL